MCVIKAETADKEAECAALREALVERSALWDLLKGEVTELQVTTHAHTHTHTHKHATDLLKGEVTELQVKLREREYRSERSRY